MGGAGEAEEAGLKSEIVGLWTGGGRDGRARSGTGTASGGRADLELCALLRRSVGFQCLSDVSHALPEGLARELEVHCGTGSAC